MTPWLPAPLARWFWNAFREGVHALSEALFPEGQANVPGYEQTDLVARTEAYVNTLPPSQGPLVALLFVAVDWLTPILVPFGPRMSRRAPEERLSIVERWRNSSWWLFRVLGNAVKASLSMVYFAHPKVFEASGEPEHGAVLVSA